MLCSNCGSPNADTDSLCCVCGGQLLVAEQALRAPGDSASTVAAGGNLVSAAVAPTVLMKAPSTRDATARTQNKTFALLICAAVVLMAGGAVWLLRMRARGAETHADTINSLSSTEDPNKLPLAFNKIFVGTMKNDVGIEMTLQRKAGALTGTYFYRPIGSNSLNIETYPEKQVWANKSNDLVLIDIQVTGTIDEQGRYVLDEVDRNGKRIGVFKGELISPTEMTVAWSRPDGKGLMSFSMKEQSGNASASSYHILVKQFKRVKKQTGIDLSYPQIEGLANNEIQNNFNQLMQRPISETLKSVDESSAQSTDESRIEESGSFAVKYRSGRLISILFHYSSDWGGAHPSYNASSFNYDLQSGRELKLKDLFRSDAPYLGVIARLCANEVNRQKRANGVDGPVTEGDVIETLKNGETFCVTEQGLIVVFGPYQLGSFAEGEYQAAIPYSALKALIDSNSVLAPLA